MGNNLPGQEVALTTPEGKVSAVTDWPTPQDAKQLRQFLGLTGFCLGGAVTIIGATKIPELAAGVVFYATDSRIRYGHFVWHLFVLGGTVCHFFAVLWYAVPTRL